MLGLRTTAKDPKLLLVQMTMPGMSDATVCTAQSWFYLRRSETIQNLPPALFTLMKSTEPWSDDYYPMDVEAALHAAGFANVVTEEADHRHRAVLGLKP